MIINYQDTPSRYQKTRPPRNAYVRNGIPSIYIKYSSWNKLAILVILVILVNLKKVAEDGEEHDPKGVYARERLWMTQRRNVNIGLEFWILILQ